MLGDVHEYMCASNGSARMMDFSMWGISWWERRLVTLFSSCVCICMKKNVHKCLYFSAGLKDLVRHRYHYYYYFIFIFFFTFFLSCSFSSVDIENQWSANVKNHNFLLKFKIVISMWLDYVSGPLLSEFIFSSFHQKLLHMSAICITGVA